MTTKEMQNECDRLAAQLGAKVGQSKANKPILFRAGKPDEVFPSWRSCLTELWRLREQLPRGETRQPIAPTPPRPIPVAQHAPPVARPAPRAAEIVPMARIVRVDAQGRIIS